jgi:homoserine/homoserine lactone efflux protein
MDIELYLAFVAATAVLVVMPGPIVTLVVANSVTYGTRPALSTVAGAQSGHFLLLLVVAAGMTSLMHVLAEGFEWLRWIGVAYLVWLGLQRWLATPAADADPAVLAVSGRRLFWQGFLVSITNPKTLFFYAAFFPQFVDPTAPPALQMTVLCGTFLVVATLFDSGYAILAGRARGWLRDRRRMKICDRVIGTFLIAAGAWLALARRA